MYLGYNWLITQKTLTINDSFVNSKQWLQVMFTYIRLIYIYIFTYEEEEGRPMMVKRKLVGAVDEF